MTPDHSKQSRPGRVFAQQPIHRRRGLAVLVLVVVVALVSLAVTTLGMGGRDDLTLAILRVESLRSFYGAESAGRVVEERLIGGTEIIAEESLVQLPHAGGISVSSDSSMGVYVVEGRSGRAVRRIELRVTR